MAFTYRRRDPSAIEKRAQGANDFVSFISNEYNLFTPKKGENWVRILPPTWAEDAEHYGLDVYVHYGIGPERASVLCLPRTYKDASQRCPICEAQERANRANDEELAKELRANKRVLCWVLDRDAMDKGALIWAMPPSVDTEIAKISKDKQTGELYAIDHPSEGYNVTFSKDGEQMKTKYTGFILDRRSSSVPDAVLDYINENPLTAALVERDYAAVSLLFSGPAPKEAESRRADLAPAARREAPDPAPSGRPRDAVDDDEIPFIKDEPPAEPAKAADAPISRRQPSAAASGGSDKMTEAQEKAARMRARFAK
jgi:hypothetical protein